MESNGHQLKWTCFTQNFNRFIVSAFVEANGMNNNEIDLIKALLFYGFVVGEEKQYYMFVDKIK